MKNIAQNIIILSCILACANAACGDSAWVKAIDADLVSVLDQTNQNNADFIANWNTFKTNVESSDTTQRNIPQYCKNVVADADATCCNSLVTLDYKKLINEGIRANIRQYTRPDKRSDRCTAAHNTQGQAVQKCVTTYLKSIKASASTSTSTSTSISTSSSGAGLGTQIQATIRANKAKGVKLLADIAKAIVPYVRGSVCLICSGSGQVSSTLFDGTNVLISQTNYDALIKSISDFLVANKPVAEQCASEFQLQYEAALALYPDSGCSISDADITAVQTAAAVCSDEASCTQWAKDHFSSAFGFKIISDAMGEDVADNTAAALRRQLAGTVTPSATGGIAPQADATEDSTLTIGDTPISSIDQEAKDADAAVVAAGGSVDLNQVTSSSVIVELLASFMMILILLN